MGTEADEKQVLLTLTKIKSLAAFKHPSKKWIYSIYPVNEFRAWILCNESSKIELTDQAGKISKSVAIKNGVSINDVICTRNGRRRTIICCGDRTVRIAYFNGSSEILFRTRTDITSICEDYKTDNIIGCHHDDGRLVKYNIRGRTLEVIDRFADGTKFFPTPFRARINGNNGDIVIVDDWPVVVVIDTTYRLLCKYGQDFDRNWTHDFEERNKLCFWDACFDSDNNIIVADYSERSVILINRNGIRLRTLWKDDNFPPISLGFSNGYLWIGFISGTVEIIKPRDQFNIPIQAQEILRH